MTITLETFYNCAVETGVAKDLFGWWSIEDMEGALNDIGQIYADTYGSGERMTPDAIKEWMIKSSNSKVVCPFDDQVRISGETIYFWGCIFKLESGLKLSNDDPRVNYWIQSQYNKLKPKKN
jgi:hypothetical protein